MMSCFEVVPDTWLKLNQDETPEYKGKPYLDATPTVLTKFWLVFPIGVTLASDLLILPHTLSFGSKQASLTV